MCRVAAKWQSWESLAAEWEKGEMAVKPVDLSYKVPRHWVKTPSSECQTSINPLLPTNNAKAGLMK